MTRNYIPQPFLPNAFLRCRNPSRLYPRLQGNLIYKHQLSANMTEKIRCIIATLLNLQQVKLGLEQSRIRTLHQIEKSLG